MAKSQLGLESDLVGSIFSLLPLPDHWSKRRIGGTYRRNDLERAHFLERAARQVIKTKEIFWPATNGLGGIAIKWATSSFSFGDWVLVAESRCGNTVNITVT